MDYNNYIIPTELGNCGIYWKKINKDTVLAQF